MHYNDIPYTTVKRDLGRAKSAKKKHRASSQCDGNGCTACHFWSGTISALSKLLGKPGVIN